MDALAELDVETIDEFQKLRHSVAHELPTYVIDPNTEIDIDLLGRTADIIRRLGQFWGRIEIDINPEFDGREIADDDIRSGPAIAMDFLLSVAFDLHDDGPKPSLVRDRSPPQPSTASRGRAS